MMVLFVGRKIECECVCVYLCVNAHAQWTLLYICTVQCVRLSFFFFYWKKEKMLARCFFVPSPFFTLARSLSVFFSFLTRIDCIYLNLPIFIFSTLSHFFRAVLLLWLVVVVVLPVVLCFNLFLFINLLNWLLFLLYSISFASHVYQG